MDGRDNLPLPNAVKTLEGAKLGIRTAHQYGRLAEGWAYAVEEFLEVMSMKLINAGVDVSDINAVREDLIAVRRDVKKSVDRLLGTLQGLEEMT